MQNIYCISGLGANEKVFQYLDLSFANPVYMNWINPQQNESLQIYATRLKEKFIHEEKPLILGLSLGGMLATEIAKQLPQAKVVIISSAKTKNEIPFYWRLFKYFPVYKILPKQSVKQNTLLRNYFLGAKKDITKNYIKEVGKNANIFFYRWAIGAILSWKNKIVPTNVFHIHGMDDKLLPHRYIRPNVFINKGGHLMIIENADEISLLIKKLLQISALM